MKLRYFIPAMIALFTLALTSCNDDDSATLLDEIQVTSSSVGIDVNGGSTSIGVNAKDTWSFDPEEIPSWLTVSPMTGNAGQTGVTFTAPEASEAEKGRQAILHINCAGKQQTINVFQGLPTVTDATVAEVLAGPEGKTYRVTGVVSSIANTEYGNWYLKDETGEVYVYGTLDKSGRDGKNNSIAAWGIEVGDIITVEGPKVLYGSTIELKNVTVVNIEKSLVKVESTDPSDATLPMEGGDITVNLTCKSNNGISVEIPEAAKEWLSIVSITGGATPMVRFHAAANAGGARNVTVVFKTTDGKKEYTAQTTINQAGSIVEAPIADFLAAEEGDTQYRLTGVITELYTSDRQGKSFYIRDYSGTVLVYRAEGFIEAGAKVGDVVTVVGKRSAYNGSPQMGSSTFEELKYSVQPISIADFRNLPDNKEAYYLISGEIVTATEENTKNDVTQYGNFNLKDSTGEVYVYGVYTGWGGQKGHFGELALTWGDQISIIAYKTTYNGLVEAVGTYLSSEKANR